MHRNTTNLLLCIMLHGSVSIAQDSSSVKQRIPVIDSIIPTIRLSLPVMKENNKILLQWEFYGFNEAAFFKVERSINGKDFEPIAIISAPFKKQYLAFVDEGPAKTLNYYRIRSEVTGMVSVYSHIVSAGITAIIHYKIFPNPVDKILIVRTDEIVDLTITDVNGKNRINQQLQRGLQLINVSMLEKGIYVLVLSRSNGGTLVTEKLVKN